MLIFLEKVCICKMFITGDLMYIFDVYWYLSNFLRKLIVFYSFVEIDRVEIYIVWF